MSRTSAHTPLPVLSAPLTLPLKARVYARQYAALYHFRLRRLAHANGRLRKRATQGWRLGSGAAEGTSKSKSKRKDDADDEGEGSAAGAHMLERLLDIRPGQMVAVCGVVYCNMRLKPDVLEDLTREVRATDGCACPVLELTLPGAAIPAAHAYADNVRRCCDRRGVPGGREWTGAACGRWRMACDARHRSVLPAGVFWGVRLRRLPLRHRVRRARHRDASR